MPSSGGSKKPITRPEAIQPRVPSTRMRGNSFSGIANIGEGDTVG
ncbi:Uncharacterised protein [Serratia odorifera]|uniref:Uncharacterized protein n=1 Tax=Serratia odorifera TaxID=618 RepID=A0A3S4DQF0_SEROD|nr:Uncharacterised protein [Serratia odorifera]